ncbi:MAG: hypothetical protein ACOH2A_12155 [Sphingobacteriaceae bacterium]
MQEPFDISAGENIYAVFPEENETFTIFKDGKEYMRIQREENKQWIKLDPETDMPIFGEDTEVAVIGLEINLFQEENE